MVIWSEQHYFLSQLIFQKPKLPSVGAPPLSGTANLSLSPRFSLPLAHSLFSLLFPPSPLLSLSPHNSVSFSFSWTPCRSLSFSICVSMSPSSLYLSPSLFLFVFLPFCLCLSVALGLCLSLSLSLPTPHLSSSLFHSHPTPI